MNSPQLVRTAIRYYLETGQYLTVPQDIDKKLTSSHQATFVSLHLKNNELRGCIGTFRPVYENTATEIIHNAVAAATQDPRFPPVRLEELPEIEISVDILSEPIIITETFKLGNPIPPEINPKTNGLIVSTKFGRRGLLLPDIDGVDSPEQQLEICYRKGGISPRETVQLEIFKVKRQQEQ